MRRQPARCRIMADLAVGMLQSVAEEMTRRPLDGWDEAIANEALLAPMLKDNDVNCRFPSPVAARPVRLLCDPARFLSVSN